MNTLLADSYTKKNKRNKITTINRKKFFEFNHFFPATFKNKINEEKSKYCFDRLEIVAKFSFQ